MHSHPYSIELDHGHAVRHSANLVPRNNTAGSTQREFPMTPARRRWLIDRRQGRRRAFRTTGPRSRCVRSDYVRARASGGCNGTRERTEKTHSKWPAVDKARYLVNKKLGRQVELDEPLRKEIGARCRSLECTLQPAYPRPLQSWTSRREVNSMKHPATVYERGGCFARKLPPFRVQGALCLDEKRAFGFDRRRPINR